MGRPAVVVPAALGAVAATGALLSVLVAPLLLRAPLDLDRSLHVTGSAVAVDPATGRQVRGSFAQDTTLTGHPRGGTATVASYDATSSATFVPAAGGAVRSLSTSSSTYAFDRRTGAGRPGVQGDTLGTTASQYKLPFDTPRRDATGWDDATHQPVPLVYRGERVLSGLTVLVFGKDVPATDLGELPVFKAVPGSWVGHPTVPSVPAHQWYAATGELYVEPTTGAVVGGRSSPHVWARTTGPLGGLEVDLLRVTDATPDAASTARLLADARHARDQVVRLQRAPWVLGSVALLLLAAALVVHRRRGSRDVSAEESGHVRAGAGSVPPPRREQRSGSPTLH